MDDSPHRLGGEGAAPAVEEDAPLPLYLPGKLPAVGLHQPQQLRGGKLHHPLLPPLAVDEQAQQALLQAEAGFGEGAKLGNPQPGAEEQLQHHNVPQGLPSAGGGGLVGVVGGPEDIPNHLARDYPGNLLGGLDAQVELLEGVFLQKAALLLLLVEGPDAGELSLHRAGGEGLV